MTKQEYKEYEEAVALFFQKEGLDCLTTSDSEEDGAVEPYFSWRACDVCCRPEGGDRYDCSGYNPTTDEVQTGYSVCADCLYYVEYGCLDDDTMMSLTD